MTDPKFGSGLYETYLRCLLAAKFATVESCRISKLSFVTEETFRSSSPCGTCSDRLINPTQSFRPSFATRKSTSSFFSCVLEPRNKISHRVTYVRVRFVYRDCASFSKLEVLLLIWCLSSIFKSKTVERSITWEFSLA